MRHPKQGRCRGGRTGIPATMNMTLAELDAIVPLSVLAVNSWKARTSSWSYF